mmetsp:Transcript_8995/g.22302  ORF Transcript_8995/g.22302 Transcript_8995/m.22302 type:complete len:309 (+) Transcript_8995:231-1157(+)
MPFMHLLDSCVEIQVGLPVGLLAQRLGAARDPLREVLQVRPINLGRLGRQSVQIGGECDERRLKRGRPDDQVEELQRQRGLRALRRGVGLVAQLLECPEELSQHLGGQLLECLLVLRLHRVEHIVRVDPRHVVRQLRLPVGVEEGEHAQVEGGQRGGKPPGAGLHHVEQAGDQIERAVLWVAWHHHEEGAGGAEDADDSLLARARLGARGGGLVGVGWREDFGEKRNGRLDERIHLGQQRVGKRRLCAEQAEVEAEHSVVDRRDGDEAEGDARFDKAGGALVVPAAYRGARAHRQAKHSEHERILHNV